MVRVPVAVLNRMPNRVAALLRRPRPRPRPRPLPDLELAARQRPWLGAVGLTAVVLVGAWLGLLVVGSVRTPVGPVNTTMALRPSLSGGTKIDVPPLGALSLDSHVAPVRLDVDVDQLDPPRAQELVDHPDRISGLQDEVVHDVEHGTFDLAVRSCVAVVAGAGLLGLAVYRRPRPALTAGGLALALLAASGASAYATWNPKSVLEPRFSGLLSSAPSVIGNARSIVTEFDVYQQELARLVTNVTKLYDVTSTLPAYQPDPSTIRVLHVSDIHLNPASWKIIASLVKQYRVNVIVDSGDTMDHGTAAENGFLDPIADLGAPYVWVRGNHDSKVTQRYLGHMKNVHVLDDGHARTVGGLRFAGMGDPQFTPDRAVAPGGGAAGGRPAGQRAAFPAGGGHAGGRRDRARAGGGAGDGRGGAAGAVRASAPRGGREAAVRDAAADGGLDRGQRAARGGGEVPGADRGIGALFRPRQPSAAGVGRDPAGRPGTGDGRGQPPSGGRQPARRLARADRPVALRQGDRLAPPVNRFGDPPRHPICFSRPRRAEKRPGGPIALIV